MKTGRIVGSQATGHRPVEDAQPVDLDETR